MALSRLRAEADQLAGDRPASSAAAEAAGAAAYLLAGLEAMLTLRPPACRVRHYPAPAFVVDRARAWAALLRGVVGVAVGFLVWDATAWSVGPTFLTNLAVALVIGLLAEDSFGSIRGFFRGNMVGVLAGIATKYLLLPASDQFAWLAVLLVPLVAIGVWAQTFGPTAGMALGYCNGLLAGVDPNNPEQYDLAGSIHGALGLLIGTAFASILFILIGPSSRREDRVRHLLDRMRASVSLARRLGSVGREQRLAWETRMYDDLRRVQAVSVNPADRSAALDLLLAGRAALVPPRKPSPPHSGPEETHVFAAAPRD